ncbi:conserved protein, unknown function [Hepatocystis sp. ex Piliocolobus tephrosceles]|nr:conserved protein, unknown function [Hepatocystis sp. ex Piliocolobus tephrosceles]
MSTTRWVHRQANDNEEDVVSLNNIKERYLKDKIKGGRNVSKRRISSSRSIAKENEYEYECGHEYGHEYKHEYGHEYGHEYEYVYENEYEHEHENEYEHEHENEYEHEHENENENEHENEHEYKYNYKYENKNAQNIYTNKNVQNVYTSKNTKNAYANKSTKNTHDDKKKLITFYEKKPIKPKNVANKKISLQNVNTCGSGSGGGNKKKSDEKKYLEKKGNYNFVKENNRTVTYYKDIKNKNNDPTSKIKTNEKHHNRVYSVNNKNKLVNRKTESTKNNVNVCLDINIQWDREKDENNNGNNVNDMDANNNIKKIPIHLRENNNTIKLKNVKYSPTPFTKKNPFNYNNCTYKKHVSSENEKYVNENEYEERKQKNTNITMYYQNEKNYHHQHEKVYMQDDEQEQNFVRYDNNTTDGSNNNNMQKIRKQTNNIPDYYTVEKIYYPYHQNIPGQYVKKEYNDYDKNNHLNEINDMYLVNKSNNQYENVVIYHKNNQANYIQNKNENCIINSNENQNNTCNKFRYNSESKNSYNDRVTYDNDNTKYCKDYDYEYDSTIYQQKLKNENIKNDYKYDKQEKNNNKEMKKPTLRFTQNSSLNQFKENFNYNKSNYDNKRYYNKQLNSYKDLHINNIVIASKILNNLLLNKTNHYFLILKEYLFVSNTKPIYTKYTPKNENSNNRFMNKIINPLFKNRKQHYYQSQDASTYQVYESNNEEIVNYQQNNICINTHNIKQTEFKQEHVNKHNFIKRYNNDECIITNENNYVHHVDNNYDTYNVYNDDNTYNNKNLYDTQFDNVKKQMHKYSKLLNYFSKKKILGNTLIDSFNNVDVNDQRRKKKYLKFFVILLSIFLKKRYHKLLSSFFIAMGSLQRNQQQKRIIRMFINTRIYFLSVLEALLKKGKKQNVKIAFTMLKQNAMITNKWKQNIPIKNDKDYEKTTTVTKKNELYTQSNNEEKNRNNFINHKRDNNLFFQKKQDNISTQKSYNQMIQVHTQKFNKSLWNEKKILTKMFQSKKYLKNACFGKPKIYRTDDYAIFYNKKILKENDEILKNCLLRSKSDSLLDFLNSYKVNKFSKMNSSNLDESIQHGDYKTSDTLLERFYTATYNLDTQNLNFDVYKSRTTFSTNKQQPNDESSFFFKNLNNLKNNSNNLAKNNETSLFDASVQTYIQRKNFQHSTIQNSNVSDFVDYSNKSSTSDSNEKNNNFTNKTNEINYSSNKDINDKHCRMFFKNIKKQLKINYTELINTNEKKDNYLSISDLNTPMNILKQYDTDVSQYDTMRNSDVNNSLTDLSFLTQSDLILVNKFAEKNWKEVS